MSKLLLKYINTDSSNDNKIVINNNNTLNVSNFTPHTQNSDTKLDEGNANEVSSLELKTHLNNQSIHEQKWYENSSIPVYSNANTFYVNDSTLNQGIFQIGRIIKYYDSNIGYCYGIVESYDTGVITISGNPYTNNISEFYYLNSFYNSNIIIIKDTIVGGFATTLTDQLLIDKNKSRFKWLFMGSYHIVKCECVVLTDDSGANKAEINFIKNSNSILSNNLQCTETWATSTGNIIKDYSTITYGDEYDVSLNSTGTNKDSEHLTFQIILIND